MNLKNELSRRRTFAIISHPDAGKTTLTEKFLLFGGAIRTAGAVKSNKINKAATSDFMEIERQRGISVATSVMGFTYHGVRINLLDTPGHKDFAEDTYRTLTAVDSVILVIDAVKGVEAQTENLMQVCRMRNTPVIVFINKMDMEGKDPFDLMDEIELKLNIDVHPLSWPISQGHTFQGVYNLYNRTLNIFSPSKTSIADDIRSITDLSDPLLGTIIDQRYIPQFLEDVNLVEGVYEKLNTCDYYRAKTAPLFFGSALNNFGVQELLDTFVNIAPPPLPTEAAERTIFPTEEKFSGFVFKIHANLDPRHRDRIAFLRVCSGRFEKSKFYYQTRTRKKIRFTTPTNFIANEKSIVDEAFPGDVVGLYDSGDIKIGDTLTEGEYIHFKGIPSFSPEVFRELINTDPLKTKQLEKGVRQLMEEGIAQLFIKQPGNRKIIGTVGELQYDVIKFRLLHEYGASCDFKLLPIYKACWLTSANPKTLENFIIQNQQNIGFDRDKCPVYMAESEWFLKTVKELHPELTFHVTSEFKTENLNEKNSSYG